MFSPKLFGPKETQSPAVVFPPANGSAAQQPAQQQPAQQQPAQQQPAQQLPAQQLPAPGPSRPLPAQPAQPSFPSQVTPPPTAQTQAPAGFKRAIEVWQVNPSIASQAAPVLSGLGVGAEAVTIQIMETQFPKGWVGRKERDGRRSGHRADTAETVERRGRAVHGAGNAFGRRAYRMTKHPIAATTGPTTAPAPFPAPQVTNPQPAAPPAPPAAQQHPAPGSVTTIPEVTITPGSQAGPVITTVRKGEGLANVAKRLGFPATGASATTIQKANLPGPDGWYTAQDLAKGGLKKKGRAGGLQPGDRLFVPPNWAVDPGAL